MQRTYHLPAATASAMRTSHYRKPLWVPTTQHQPTNADITADLQQQQQQQQQHPTTTGTSLLWHSRIDQSGRLPPVLGTSTDGTPIFAFLGNGRLLSKKSKRSALQFYREFVNAHFGPDPSNPDASPACIYRITCNQPPDFTFEYVSATWDFQVQQASLERKLALGLGPPTVQHMYNKHGRTMSTLDIQWVEGMPHVRTPNQQRQSKHGISTKADPDQPDQDEDVFDFCDTLATHMKQVGKGTVLFSLVLHPPYYRCINDYQFQILPFFFILTLCIPTCCCQLP